MRFKNWSKRRNAKIQLLRLDEIQNEKARRHLINFTTRTFPAYEVGWFHRRICEIIDTFVDDVEHYRSPRLIISSPPQHGKSELVSRRLPAYLLGRNPDWAIIQASHSADLAAGFSNDVQKIIDSPQYHAIFPSTRIPGEFARANQARRSASFFQIVGHRGQYRAAGTGSGITGLPANILICDDLIKDFADATSEATRESTWDWLTSTAFSRVQQGGGIIMMQTRWHMDDPIGRLITRQAGRWKTFNFAAISEEDELPYRRAGEPLSVERYSLESLLAIRDGGATSSYQWSALYQGRPSPLGGGIFKRDDWQFYKEAPTQFSQIIQSWDCSFKDRASSDFVVGQVWGVAGAGRYLLDQVRGHMSFSRTVEAIRQMSAKWPSTHRKLIEDKANGSAVIDYLKNEIPGLIAIQPSGGKEARAHAVSAYVEAHNVFLPQDQPWVDAFIEECSGFPTAQHDDMVDCFSQALNYIQSNGVHLTLVDWQLAQINNVLSATDRQQQDPRCCPNCSSIRIEQRGPRQWKCRACTADFEHVAPDRTPAPPPKGSPCPRCGLIMVQADEGWRCRGCKYPEPVGGRKQLEEGRLGRAAWH